MVRNYDPKQVAVIVGGQSAHGFGDGTFVKVGRMSAQWALKVGVDGEGTRAKSNDKSGFIEITLMRSSSYNDYLSGLAATDELSSTGAVPASVRDNSGSTVFGALTAWIKQIPDDEFTKEMNTITWRLETDELNSFIGGNNT